MSRTQPKPKGHPVLDTVVESAVGTLASSIVASADPPPPIDRALAAAMAATQPFIDVPPAVRKADHYLADMPETGIQPTGTIPSTEATALIEVACGRRPLTPFNPDPDGRRRLATSLPLDTPAGKLQAYRATTSQDCRAEDVIGKIFPVRHWLQHDCQKVVPETGEIQKWVRTVLICEDGTRISCGSDGVIGSIMSLEAFFGPPPWSPAAQLSIETGRSRSGYTYYTLDVH